MLIDEWMPTYHAVERHQVRIAAPRERVWNTVRRMEFGRPWVIRALMAVRTLPARLAGRGRKTGDEEGDDGAGGLLRAGFVLLDERPGEELLIGVAGKFWRPSGNIVRVSADEIRAFTRPGFAVATWNFALAEEGTHTVLSTETRVRCTDEASRRSFLRYWRIVGPFSALIRVELLKSIRRAVESPVPAVAATERR
jgi:hypothetical protein